jgi:hypothetical protein
MDRIKRWRNFNMSPRFGNCPLLWATSVNHPHSAALDWPE